MANRIKALRLSKGLKQSDLADILGVRQNTLSTWETGRYEPDSSSLIQLADFFGVSIDYLLGREQEIEKAPDTAEAVPGALTEKEQEFLTYAGQMTQEQKSFLVAVMRALIEQGQGQSPGPSAGADERG